MYLVLYWNTFYLSKNTWVQIISVDLLKFSKISTFKVIWDKVGVDADINTAGEILTDEPSELCNPVTSIMEYFSNN